jgi:GAF domain-containing protein/anti-sigma regulatory factor (Ser/Thr protein kinase)
MSPEGSPVISPEFLHELESARRRLDVLEEANRAIQGLVDRIGCLSAFSEGLERSGSPDEVADLLFEEVQSIVPSEVLLLALQANGDKTFQPLRLMAPPASAGAVQQELEAQLGAGMVRWALEARRPTMVAAHHLGGHLVLVPLVTARRAVGLLLAGTALPAEVIAQEQLTLVAVAARQAAERLENLHLAEELRQQNLALRQAAEAAQACRVADLGLLVEAARTVSGPLDPESILQVLTEETCRHLNVRVVSIALVDGEGRLRIAASTGMPPECLDCLDVAGGHGGLPGWVAEHGTPLAVPDVWADPRYRCCAVGREAGLRSFLGVPMAARERPIGVLSVMTDAPRQFSPEEVALLSGLAAQGALAIENARLHGQALRRSEELGALLRASRSVMADLGLAEILHRIVEEAARMAGTPHVKLLLLDRERRRLQLGAAVGRPRESLEGFELSLGAGLSGIVAATGEPLFVADCQHDPRNLYAAQDRALGLVAYLGLPIRIREAVVGVLTFNTDRARSYTLEELTYLASFADQAAVAIENARLVEDLQRRVAEQQRAMARLVQTARMATVGLLAAGVAHDVNNPLCVISNHLQLLRLRNPSLPQEVDTALQAVEDGVQRIAARIQALLDYAQGKPGERGRHDVNETVERVLCLLQSHPLYRRLTIRTEYGADLPPVALDRVAWEQVLLELLSNAREAMPSGGSVWIATRRVPAGDSSEWVEVTIQDDGPGIAPKDLSRIFDPFFTTKGTPGCMGLGLTIARDLVAEHGARLQVQSDGRQGTRVAIRLPAAPAAHRPGDGAPVRRGEGLGRGTAAGAAGAVLPEQG